MKLEVLHLVGRVVHLACPTAFRSPSRPLNILFRTKLPNHFTTPLRSRPTIVDSFFFSSFLTCPCLLRSQRLYPFSLSTPFIPSTFTHNLPTHLPTQTHTSTLNPFPLSHFSFSLLTHHTTTALTTTYVHNRTRLSIIFHLVFGNFSYTPHFF